MPIAAPRHSPVRAPSEHSMTEHSFTQPTVRAPEFQAGLDWINTAGRALTLADLRGKITLLDFWTYG
jgi:hypothetical protein